MPKKNQNDNVELFHGYSIYIPTRTIYIGSESSSDALIEHGEESGVDHSMSDRFLKNLHILESLSEEPITVILNNPGGDWYHGMAIYDAIKNSKCEITVTVYGHAMSMASVILQAADKRIMAPNAKLMIHYGSMGSSSTHSKIFDKWSEENKKINLTMEDIYLERMREKHPEFPISKLRKMLNFDSILNAEETVRYGLADEVLNGQG